jgi:hypothetical protein
MTQLRAQRTGLVALGILFAVTLGTAQTPPANPTPGQSDGIIGPQLIAWSALQKPEPVPQKPQPIPGPGQTQPSSQDQYKQADGTAQSNPQQPEPETQQTPAQSISGTIAKVNNRYVLQTSDSVTYQLDDQTNVAQYVGKRVKVTGTLDRSTGTIRVRSVELLS